MSLVLSRYRAKITDSNIPASLAIIDTLIWSEEARHGRYLIEISMGKPPEVGFWDLKFFRLARTLFLQLSDQEQRALSLSYDTGTGKNDPILKSAKTATRYIYELYQSGVSTEFLDFILSTFSLIDKRELPLEDWGFAFTHPNGCNGTELVVQMGKSGKNSSLTYAVTNNGAIKATKVGGQWLVKQEEIIRVLDLHRNWIGIRQASLEKKLYRGTLACYLEEILGAEIRPNLSGASSFLRSIYDELDVLIPEISRQKEISRTNWGDRKLGEKELSASSIYRKYKKHGLELGTIKHWVKTKMLPSTTRKKFRVVATDNFKLFAVTTALRQNKVRSKYRSIFCAICEEENWI